jgi:hypothetical protein
MLSFLGWTFVNAASCVAKVGTGKMILGTMMVTLKIIDTINPSAFPTHDKSNLRGKRKTN